MSVETVGLLAASRDEFGDVREAATAIPLEGASVRWESVERSDGPGPRRRRRAVVVFQRAVEVSDTDQLVIRDRVYDVIGVDEVRWRWSTGVAGSRIHVEGVF